VARITQNIKNRLKTLITYGGVPTVELERLILNINDRYPFVELCGPWADVEVHTKDLAETNLTYQINYYNAINDESQTENTEITYITRLVTADIIKHIMNDQSRGGLAQRVTITDYGYTSQVTENDTVEFLVYVIFEVQSLIRTNNPYFVG